MATLKNHHKEFIVKELACFTAPSEIAKQLKEEYGITVTLSQLAFYNPENTQAQYQLSVKWRHLFHRTRDDFIEGVIEIPIVHKQYRLAQLQQLYEKLKSRGEYIKALKVLEQAAKEVGEYYGDMNEVIQRRKEKKEKNLYQEINEKIVRCLEEDDN